MRHEQVLQLEGAQGIHHHRRQAQPAVHSRNVTV